MVNTQDDKNTKRIQELIYYSFGIFSFFFISGFAMLISIILTALNGDLRAFGGTAQIVDFTIGIFIFSLIAYLYGIKKSTTFIKQHSVKKIRDLAMIYSSYISLIVSVAMFFYGFLGSTSCIRYNYSCTFYPTISSIRAFLFGLLILFFSLVSLIYELHNIIKLAKMHSSQIS